MAPLSGLQERQLAPLWTRAGALLFTHGDRFYNFEGLRRYKDEVPAGLGAALSGGARRTAAAAVLADVTTLVSGSTLGDRAQVGAGRQRSVRVLARRARPH